MASVASISRASDDVVPPRATKIEVAALLCNAVAARRLDSLTPLAHSELCPAALEEAEADSGTVLAAPRSLGSFLVLEEGTAGRGGRIMVRRAMSCKCGRWQRQSTDRPIRCTGSDGRTYLVVRETLRWEVWSEDAKDFVTHNYKAYCYSIHAAEGGQVIHQSNDALGTWVERFQWGANVEGGDRSTRIVFYHAFYDPPRRGIKRNADTQGAPPSPGTPVQRPRHTPGTPVQRPPHTPLSPRIAPPPALLPLGAFEGALGGTVDGLGCEASTRSREEYVLGEWCSQDDREVQLRALEEAKDIEMGETLEAILATFG